MKVKNKWNGKVYTVIEITEIVKLRREDGSEFIINKSEFYTIYKEVCYG